MTTPANVVLLKQENDKAHGRTGALSEACRDRRMWLVIRRSLLLAVKAIEDRYDLKESKPSTH